MNAAKIQTSSWLGTSDQQYSMKVCRHMHKNT